MTDKLLTIRCTEVNSGPTGSATDLQRWFTPAGSKAQMSSVPEAAVVSVEVIPVEYQPNDTYFAEDEAGDCVAWQRKPDGRWRRLGIAAVAEARDDEAVAGWVSKHLGVVYRHGEPL